MNDRVCVHGAAGSIGSSCVEIISGRNHLILDYGKPLEGEASVPFEFPNNPKFRKNYKVFISHSHADHAGYITEIPEDVEVYMHEMTYKALMLQNSDYGKRVYSTVHGYEIIRWNGINIMFIPVNHSAPDACGILIATKNQTLLYTGDFRLHGSFLSRYSDIVKAYLKEEDFSREKFNVITEATNVGSKYSEQNIEISEPDIIEKDLLEEFKKPGLIVVRMANQNIERLKTIYDACIKTDRILVTEPYTALCAKELSSYVESCPLLIHRTASHPYNMFPDGEKWKVFCFPTSKTQEMRGNSSLYQFGGDIKITKEELVSNSDKIVIVANTQSQNYLRKNKLVNRIIWSMWDGYPEYEILCKKYDVKQIHVSGHIYEKYLQFFIEDLKPENTIIIHTEKPNEVKAVLKDLTKVILPTIKECIELQRYKMTNLQDKIEKTKEGSVLQAVIKEQELVDYIYENAFKANNPIKMGLISILMPGKELMERILGKYAGIEYERILRDDINEKENLLLLQATNEIQIKSHNLLIHDTPCMVPQFINDQIEKMVRIEGVNTIFVEATDEKEVSFELPKLAKELGIKIVEFYFNYK